MWYPWKQVSDPRREQNWKKEVTQLNFVTMHKTIGQKNPAMQFFYLSNIISWFLWYANMYDMENQIVTNELIRK